MKTTKNVLAALSVCLLTICTASTAYAGTWKQDAAGWLWLNDNGTRPVNKWQWCDGNRDGLSECYYFDADGHCLTDTVTPDGYTVNQDGAWTENGIVRTRRLSGGPGGLSTTSGTSQQAIDKVNELGGTLQAAYNWCACGGITYMSDFALNDDLGIRHYANRGFSTQHGDCYDMACCLCEMARALGYEANCISGYVPLRKGGITPHCWCEIVIDGTTYVFDPDFQYERGTNGYMINYGQKGTWRYQDYHAMHD